MLQPFLGTCIHAVTHKRKILGTGITILSHSIESLTLPTHHAFDVRDMVIAAVNERSNTTYAQDINFCSTPAEYEDDIIPPPLGYESLYLATNLVYDPLRPPFIHHTYQTHYMLTPHVLWSQPYKQLPGVLNYSLILGLKIENNDIDSTICVLPNPYLSLRVNNSHYMQGSLPINKIKPILPDGTATYPFYTRMSPPYGEELIGYSFRDSSRVTYPIICSSRVQANSYTTPLQGIVSRENFNTTENAFTFTAFKSNEDPSIPDSSVHLWSSYRYTPNVIISQKDTFMYATLRSLYGLDTSTSSSPNPVLLLPQ